MQQRKSIILHTDTQISMCKVLFKNSRKSKISSLPLTEKPYNSIWILKIKIEEELFVSFVSYRNHFKTKIKFWWDWKTWKYISAISKQLQAKRKKIGSRKEKHQKNIQGPVTRSRDLRWPVTGTLEHSLWVRPWTETRQDLSHCHHSEKE